MEHKSDEGYFLVDGDRDDRSFHDEILDNPRANKLLSKIAIQDAVVGGVDKELAKRLYSQ